MDENSITKNVFNVQPIGTGRKGRPNLRWIDGLEKYFLDLRNKNWRIYNQEEGWRGKGFLRRPRSTLNCLATEEGKNLIDIEIQDYNYMKNTKKNRDG
ncbi:hypothetical protein TNCV_4265871 [Trichonephila clavipes]|nr:hypothetical protein TNCV_4265871 [Trichonephila clavipes]